MMNQSLGYTDQSVWMCSLIRLHAFHSDNKAVLIVFKILEQVGNEMVSTCLRAFNQILSHVLCF